MTDILNIIALLAGVFLVSYVINRVRKVPNPAKDSLKLTGILGAAFVILGAIVYISIIASR